MIISPNNWFIQFPLLYLRSILFLHGCHWIAVMLFSCLDVLLPLLFINTEEIFPFNVKDRFNFFFFFFAVIICHLQLCLTSESFVYLLEKTINNNKEEENEWISKYQERLGGTLWTTFVKMLLPFCMWWFTVSVPGPGESTRKPCGCWCAQNQGNTPS